MEVSLQRNSNLNKTNLQAEQSSNELCDDAKCFPFRTKEGYVECKSFSIQHNAIMGPAQNVSPHAQQKRLSVL